MKYLILFLTILRASISHGEEVNRSQLVTLLAPLLGEYTVISGCNKLRGTSVSATVYENAYLIFHEQNERPASSQLYLRFYWDFPAQIVKINAEQVFSDFLSLNIITRPDTSTPNLNHLFEQKRQVRVENLTFNGKQIRMNESFYNFELDIYNNSHCQLERVN